MNKTTISAWIRKGKRWKWLSMTLLMLVSFGLCLLTTTANYQIRMAEYFAQTDNLADAELILQRTLLEREMRFIAGDLRYLGRSNLMERVMDEHTPQTMEDLESTIVTFASERNIYDQIRLLDIEGNELLRVECSNRIPVIIPDSELQAKNNRYYFQHAMQLRRGRIYVSPLDLNMEDGRIERPVKPTVRFAMGVYNRQGMRQGVLILNYNAKSFLEILRTTSDAYNVRFMLVNADGFWVSHPNPAYEWGQFISERANHNFATQSKEVWEQIKSSDSGRLVVGDKHYSFNTFDLQGMPEFVTTTTIVNEKDASVAAAEASTILKHIAILPEGEVSSFKLGLVKQNIVIGVIWMLLSILPAWGLTSLLTNRRIVHQQLAQQARYDKITGIANRVHFNEQLAETIEKSAENKQLFALLYIDLDGFKAVNDTKGHKVGDEILAQSATRMVHCVRDTDMVARLGGDEFAIILTNIDDPVNATKIGEKVVRELCKSFKTSKGEVTIGASLGVAVYPDDAHASEQLMELADASMYEHKKYRKSQALKFSASEAI